jgi:hypothetical protein
VEVVFGGLGWSCVAFAVAPCCCRLALRWCGVALRLACGGLVVARALAVFALA